jgi:hypothetical protein
MRIENLRKETMGDRSRVCARIVWEKAALPERELFFETTASYADDLTLDPNAFLLACILPAMANGEKRILVDGPLCPELASNLMVATGWGRKWYGPPRRPVAIRSTSGMAFRRPAISPPGCSRPLQLNPWHLGPEALRLLQRWGNLSKRCNIFLV